MMTTSGQVITTSTGNFPQYMISALGNSTFKTCQNQLPSLQPSSFYVSTMPVHPSSQVFNGSRIREIPSQPQIITTQATEATLNQAQSLGLQTVNSLQPVISWAPSNVQLYQNPIIFYNQQTGIRMAMHLPVAATLQPVPLTSFASANVSPSLKKQSKLVPKVTTSGTSHLSNRPMTTICGNVSQELPTPVAQQKSMTVYQTNSNQVEIVNEGTISTGIETKPVSAETKISLPQKSQATVATYSKKFPACVVPTPTVDISTVSITPATLNIGSSTDASTPLSNTELDMTDANINQISTPVAQQKFAVNPIDPNLAQIVSDETVTTGVEDKPVSVETKISSPQKLQANVTAFSNIPHPCLQPTSTVEASAVSATPSPLTIGSSTDKSVPLSNTQLVTTDTYINQVPSILVAQQKFVATDPIDPNLTQIVSDETITTGMEDKPVSIETKISSSQKSQAKVTDSSEILRACPTPISTIDVSIVSTKSSVQVDTSLSSVDAIISSVPTVSSISPVSCFTNRLSCDFNSKLSVPKTPNKTVFTSDQTNTTETVITTEQLKPEESIQQLTSEPVNDKQKAIVKPQVLTHVINGFVIQESSEPFPISQAPLLDSPSRILPPAVLNSQEERETALTEKKVRVLRSQSIVELVTCEFCGKSGSYFRIKRKRRFCSKSCAKQFKKLDSKLVQMSTSAVQGYVGSGGRGRKRKKRRGRKRLQKQSLVEKENANAVPAEENSSIHENLLTVSSNTREMNYSPENESMVSHKTVEENSAPASNSPNQISMEVDRSDEEVEMSRLDFSQKLPSKWSVQDVFEFVQNFPGCSDYADNFISQEVDGQALLLLNDVHLTTALCMKLGPALKLLSQIRSMEEKLKS